MKQHEFEIRLEDAFVPMPPEISDVIERAFERGEKAMKKRYKIMSALSTAAVISVFFAVAAMAVNGINAPKPDKVALSAADSKQQMESAPVTEPYPETQPGEEIKKVSADYSGTSFYDGDFSDPEAIYVLLSNAYWTYAKENNLEMDSRAVFAAAGELKELFINHEGAKEQMIEPIRECLQSVLGLDSDFIAKHYLTNDVIGCLYAATETMYQEESVVLMPVNEENIETREEINQAAAD